MYAQMNANQMPPIKSNWRNEEIAEQFDRIAELIEAQRANPYRVTAYRNAAKTLRELQRPAQTIVQQQGFNGLKKLPGIGESLARAIGQLIGTGSIGLLNQLQGEVEPEQILTTVPGIGPRLAQRIHDQLGVENLRDLQLAALDGRLSDVPGLGHRRLQAVRESLMVRLPALPKSRTRAASAKNMPNLPSVQELLHVDEDYRTRAAADDLPRIAPKRFNPSNRAWLPVLHTQRGQTHYTALFSNTARAQEQKTTQDWVVIYRDDESGAGQWTVVTEGRGKLRNKRVVRGRERDCELYYAQLPPQYESETSPASI